MINYYRFFQDNQESEEKSQMAFVYVGSTVWCSFVIIDFVYIIVSKLSADWYYLKGKNDKENQMSLFKGIKWLFRYHFGSVAFGAFLIRVFQFLQLILFTFKTDKKD